MLEREKQARTVAVEVALTNKQDMQQLLAGYSADVEIITARHDNVLRIPADALLEDGSVYVVSGGKAEKRPIKTGLSNWDFVEIRHGLTAGERIVTSLDREGLRDGVAVTINNDDGPQP